MTLDFLVSLYVWLSKEPKGDSNFSPMPRRIFSDRQALLYVLNSASKRLN